MGLIFAAIQWYGAPLVMFGVSLAYFFGAPRRPAYLARLVAALPGILGIVLYFVGMALFWLDPNAYRPSLRTPYTALFLIPVLASIACFFTFRGPKIFHLLQIPNLLALAWALFVGGMAVTGDRL